MPENKPNDKPKNKPKEVRGERALSPLDIAFINEVTRIDINRPTSYREALIRIKDVSKWKSRSVNNEASRIARKPKVIAAIAKIRAQREKDRRRTFKSTASAIEARLWVEAKDADKASDRINALKILYSMLPPPTEEEAADSLKSKEELIERIEEVFERAVGKPVDITAQAQSSQTLSEVLPAVGSDSDSKPSSFEDVEVLDVESKLVN